MSPHVMAVSGGSGRFGAAAAAAVSRYPPISRYGPAQQHMSRFGPGPTTAARFGYQIGKRGRGRISRSVVTGGRRRGVDEFAGRGRGMTIETSGGSNCIPVSEIIKPVTEQVEVSA